MNKTKSSANGRAFRHRGLPTVNTTRAGHADVDMTKHYLHVQDPVRLGAIAKFDAAFFEKEHLEHPNIIEFFKSS